MILVPVTVLLIIETQSSVQTLPSHSSATPDRSQTLRAENRPDLDPCPGIYGLDWTSISGSIVARS